jgi:DNA-binding HxlR family transcriptional regulator
MMMAMARSVPPHVNVRCEAFQVAIDVLGRPWNGMILAALQIGPLRYSELIERVEGVGDKILSARLKDLEKRGIVNRQVEPGPPVRVAYVLTAKGKAFSRVAESIQRWGQTLVR